VKLQVLGCHGGELPRCKSTCFLVDGVLALDAGALTATLPLEEVCRVDDILVTHSHFDHVKDLPLLADLVVGQRDRPITIHASSECARTLRDNMFNNSLWPDFTKIPTAKKPVLQIKPFKAGSTFKIGKYQVQSVKVSHPVESCGFVVTNGGVSVAISGDTGPTDKLWKLLNKVRNLKAVLLETSFPNRMQELADISGHLTPQTLKTELGKFQRNGAAVLLYHLKPVFVPQLKKELQGMPVEVLELGDTFEF
jgi:ribonuclease BN (tRNA processing enzyme)